MFQLCKPISGWFDAPELLNQIEGLHQQLCAPRVPGLRQPVRKPQAGIIDVAMIAGHKVKTAPETSQNTAEH